MPATLCCMTSVLDLPAVAKLFVMNVPATCCGFTHQGSSAERPCSQGAVELVSCLAVPLELLSCLNMASGVLQCIMLCAAEVSGSRMAVGPSAPPVLPEAGQEQAHAAGQQLQAHAASQLRRLPARMLRLTNHLTPSSKAAPTEPMSRAGSARIGAVHSQQQQQQQQQQSMPSGAGSSWMHTFCYAVVYCSQLTCLCKPCSAEVIEEPIIAFH